MNDEELHQAFQAIPEPDSEAKKRAVNLAMAEFQAVQRAEAVEPGVNEKNKKRFFQGFLSWWRLTGDNNPERNTTMPFAQKKLIIGGMATSSLVVLGAVMFTQYSALLDQPRVNPVHEEFRLTEALPAPAPELRHENKNEDRKVAAEAAADTSVHSTEEIAPTEPQLASSHAPKPALAMRTRKAHNHPQLGPAPVVSADSAYSPPKEYRDRFEEFTENSIKSVMSDPVSTFSVDVDTAAYSFVRRSLNEGHLPPKNAVRVEEMVNYFDYTYPVPKNKSAPFSTSVAVMDSPWKKGNQLIHIGIKGYQIPAQEIPRSNLVFLLDVSGSMEGPDRLPLVQQSMEMLLNHLKPDDTVAIVVYAGAAGTVLEPTKASEKRKILSAVKQLSAGGSTAGGAGIQLAYQLAEANFDPKAVNRIILATDGDFNVGYTGDSDLQTLVERKRDKGIYLSVLGFGRGNYQDAMMQTLAQHGNGVAAYIDTLSEAQKVLVHEATSMLFPIASDVKIQVEFNPATVAEYRLIGYETRGLNREDFANDKVDAGDIGAGHTVTAIYEITPVGGNRLLEQGRYQASSAASKAKSDELAFLRIRYKLPGEKQSQLIEQPITPKHQVSLSGKIQPDSLQQEAGFATAVAGFAQLLRGGKFVSDFTYDDVIALAQRTRGIDEYGHRNEFVQLVRKAKMAKEL